jgi:glycosyltransferase involved in cell wall biosynthesis
MKRIAFLVNGEYESAMGHRARAFQTHLASRYDIRIAYRSRRKLFSILRFIAFLLWNRPMAAYVFDMAYSGVIAAGIYKTISRRGLIIDTGDCISALARSMGRGAVGVWLTQYLETLSLCAADRIVVRGSFHRDMLLENHIRAELIHDGVDIAQFAPGDVSQLRSRMGLDGVLTVGMVGTSIWSGELRMCYGWELVETIRLLRDKPVKGIFIGGGSGIAYLKARCREYGIEDRIVFAGYVPYEKLPAYLNMIDVCLSTQTNDIVGRVRTTGKLPLYLAAGRYVLASRVGEAALVLPDEMLIDYHGVIDPNYPVKLAERILNLLKRQWPFEPSVENLALARNFDYSVLAERVDAAILGCSRQLVRNHSQIVAKEAAAEESSRHGLPTDGRPLRDASVVGVKEFWSGKARLRTNPNQIQTQKRSNVRWITGVQEKRVVASEKQSTQ